jgi:hypothetical protein
LSQHQSAQFNAVRSTAAKRAYADQRASLARSAGSNSRNATICFPERRLLHRRIRVWVPAVKKPTFLFRFADFKRETKIKLFRP